MAGINISSIYDRRPNTDGLGLVSGSPSVNTSIGSDDSVVIESELVPILRYPYRALSINR